MLLAAWRYPALRGGRRSELERRRLGLCKVLPFARTKRVGAPEGGLGIAKTASGLLERLDAQLNDYLVDPASNHMLVSKIKPCMSKYMPK